MLNKKLFPALFIAACLMCTACADDKGTGSKSSGDHVWKEQTQTIDKAKEVEGILEDAAAEQRKLIEEQSH